MRVIQLNYLLQQHFVIFCKCYSIKNLLKFLCLFRGTKTLQEILCDRENISHSMQVHLDEGTDPWGVKVERVEM